MKNELLSDTNCPDGVHGKELFQGKNDLGKLSLRGEEQAKVICETIHDQKKEELELKKKDEERRKKELEKLKKKTNI